MRPTYYLHEGVLSPEDCNVIIAEGSAKAQKPKQGTMTTFPSLMLHRAKPVWWGTRHALVLWGLVQEPANVARGT